MHILVLLFIKQEKAIGLIYDGEYGEHTSKLFCDMKLLTICQVIR